MADKTGSIIIKRVKKGHAAGHGGAWKVAYADFVTAMMAFFLLLWLLNAVTQEQLEGISNYFAPQSASATTSGSGAVLGGQSIAEPGAIGNPIKPPPMVAMDLPAPSAGQGSTGTDTGGGSQDVDQQTAEEIIKKKEEEQFQQAEETLKQAIQSIPSMKELAKSLVVDDTPEGMRIQIVDQEGLAMFPRGTSDMYDHTKKVLSLVAKVIEKMPQKISIAGHTDSTKFAGAVGYSNWELSADRANASRRALIDLGVPENRLSQVVGKAAEDPLVANDPANPRNRRITIVLLRGTGDGKGAAGDSGGMSLPPAPTKAQGG